jgi:hypothetical protein
MVEGDRALVANFELDTHTITLNVADVTVDVQPQHRQFLAP